MKNKWRSKIRPGSDELQLLGKHKRYSRLACFFLNVFDPRVPCKCGCKWISPYGYTRNASCPRHD